MRHSTYLEVNLQHLGDNLSKIRKLTPAKILPMVKANAYGNGLFQVSKFLVQECGVTRLGCATLGEAIHLFNHCPDLDAEVMVFSDSEVTSPEIAEAYQNFSIIPVLHNKSDVEAVLTDPMFKKLPIVLKMNTGMNRLGFSLEELAELAPKLKHRGVKHLMTHLACSYYTVKPGDKNHRQLDGFSEAKKILKDAGVSVQETSVANSGAIEQKFAVNETFVRPGLMLYGPASVEPRLWDGKQVSRFVTKVLKTYEVKRGTPFGYGAQVTPEDGFVAILPVGYADLSVTTASGAEITINGFQGKVFARVNMDLMYVFFAPTVAGRIKVGDQVEFWNHDNRVIGELAVQMKTIPYHLMCSVSGRVPRIYKA